MNKILVINGPNLNKLGMRDKSHYGSMTLNDVEEMMAKQGLILNMEVTFFQSNGEGEIIDVIHESDEYDGVIINAGAYTHYSYAIADALEMLQIPIIEVHLSNIHNREEFRSKSVLTKCCVGQISGFQEESYRLALYALDKILLNNGGNV